MSVFEKFKESLSAEDFAQLEESVNSVIEDKAKVRAELLVEEKTKQLEAMAEDFAEIEVANRLEEKLKEINENFEKKTSEYKAVVVEKVQELAEKYCEEKIQETLSLKIQELEEQYEEKVELIEQEVTDKLDSFLDAEILDRISPDLIKGIAINEALQPIVSGIMSLFENSLVAIDTDGDKIVKAEQAKAKKMEEKLNEAYSVNTKLQSKIDGLKTGLLIAGKVEGLTTKQKESVVSMFEGKSYDEVKAKIDEFVEILEERDSSLDDDDEVSLINEDLFVSHTKEMEDEEEVVVKPTDKDIRFKKINELL